MVQPRDAPNQNGNNNQSLIDKLKIGAKKFLMMTPLYDVYLLRKGKLMIMVIYFVEQIEDQHSNFGFKNVPRIYKKRVKEMLIMHGNAELADDNFSNYVGPRPQLDLDEMLKAAKEKVEQEMAEESQNPKH